MNTVNYQSTFNKPPYLFQQFVDSDIAVALHGVNAQNQAIEDAGQDFQTKLWLNEAVGEQLDVLGIHLGISRNGLADEPYRVVLKLKAFLSLSGGTPESVIAACKILFEATRVEYKTMPYAKVQIIHNGIVNVFSEYNLWLFDGDFLVDHDGNQMIAMEKDRDTINFIYSLLPAGVGISMGFPFADHTGDLFVTDTGDSLFVVLPL